MNKLKEIKESSAKNLLIEIGVEELPTQSLIPTAQTFQSLLIEKLIENEFIDSEIINKANLSKLNLASDYLVTPRRIACRIEGVKAQSKEKISYRRGPKQGTQTEIVEKFANANGLKITDLDVKATEKGSYYFATIQEKPKQLSGQIGEMIESILKNIASKKSMRWANFDFAFLRPIHWLVLIHGNQTIKTKVWNLTSSNQSLAHRFHHSGAITIDDEKNYETILKNHQVLVSVKDREQSMINQIIKKFPEAQNQLSRIQTYAAMVSNLVEYPVVLVGEIKQKYLKQLPVEVIETILMKHQFCFMIHKKLASEKNMSPADEVLEPYFISVANLKSKNPGLVVEGYQKVIGARLEDGLFFYQNDSKKNHFQALSQKLDSLVFHTKLGSYKQKIKRMLELSDTFNQQKIINQKQYSKLKEVTSYAKNDLLTQSVIEMPSLQGVFGAYLARNFIADDEVILAIKEQYLPIARYDNLPSQSIGQFLSLIDKLDCLVGLWLVGHAPKGSKDPFALRRMALAIVRLLIESDLKIKLNLKDLLIASIQTYQKQNQKLISNLDKQAIEIEQFINERMEVYLIEKYQKLPVDLIQAVLNKTQQFYLFELEQYIVELYQFYQNQLGELNQVLASLKRIQNMLKNSKIEANLKLDEKLLNQPQEKALIKKINSKLKQSANLTDSLKSLASWNNLIDDFLDNIQINCQDEALKNQRHLLLMQIKTLFNQIPVDLSAIQNQEK